MRKILTGLYFVIIFLSHSFIIEVKDKDLDIQLEMATIKDLKNNNEWKTDVNGRADIKVNEGSDLLILLITYPGYESKRVLIDPRKMEESVTVFLGISNVIEGKELVIEGKKGGSKKIEDINKKEVTKEEFKSTAIQGPIQDIMNTIKNMPGVSFTSRFSPNFSIRGSEPDDLVVISDDFIVRNPWHWGGGVSIFNPNVIEKVDFSSGIFGVENGLATSGLMEASSYSKIDGVKFKLVGAMTTSEVLLEVPFKNIASFYIGGRLSITDLPLLFMKDLVVQQGFNLTRTPYFYEGYSRINITPSDRFNLSINGFFGIDGIGVETVNSKKEAGKVYNSFKFLWENIISYGNIKFNILPNDKVHIYFLLGYDYFRKYSDGEFTFIGTKRYSQEFINTYGFLLGGKEEFNINTTSKTVEINNEHAIQTSFKISVMLRENIEMVYGFIFLPQFNSFDKSGNMYRVYNELGEPKFGLNKVESDLTDKWLLQSGTFLNFNFSIIPDKLIIETGIRVDHSYMVGENLSVNTYPTVLPRFNLTFSPFKRNNVFEKINFSIGAGVFSKMPKELLTYSKNIKIEDFQISITKSFNINTGMEIFFPLNIRFSMEGYFKYYFDRFYINEVRNSDGILNYYYHSDGLGLMGGLDVVFERKISRYIDGSLVYSFNWTKLYNPYGNGNDRTTKGQPLGFWFYPLYHRFHNLNFILNIRPVDFFTITPKLTFTTGRPVNVYSNKTMFIAKDDKTNDYLELYTRNTNYSEDNRGDFSIPFDLTLSWNFTVPKSKLYLEFFVSGEDIFSPLYTPKRGTRIDLFSGEEILSPDSVFNIGVPLVSLGFSMSY